MVKALASVAGTLAVTVTTALPAQDRIGPVESYLLDRTHELALARSAAPKHVADNAALMVLTDTGYQRVHEGSNGFVCLVNRGWQARPHAEFWSPKTVAPVCHNAHAAMTILPYHLRRTELALAGHTMAQVDSIAMADFSQGRLQLPGGRAFSYMVSDAGYAVIPGYEGPVPPHVMIWMPNVTQADLGDNEPFSMTPFVLGPGTPLAVAIIPVGMGVSPSM